MEYNIPRSGVHKMVHNKFFLIESQTNWLKKIKFGARVDMVGMFYHMHKSWLGFFRLSFVWALCKMFLPQKCKVACLREYLYTCAPMGQHGDNKCLSMIWGRAYILDFFIFVLWTVKLHCFCLCPLKSEEVVYSPSDRYCFLRCKANMTLLYIVLIFL